MRRLWTASDDARMRALHAMGASSCEIAEWLEFNRSTVKRRMREVGLAPLLERTRWNDDMDRTLRLNYPLFPSFLIAHVLGIDQIAVYNRAHYLGIKKSPDYWRQPNAKLWANWDHPAQVASRFVKGQVAHNKGLRRPGWAPGRMAETQFKRGRPKHESRNYRPIGSLRITRDGMLERKVTDDHPVPARRWVAEHRLVWERAHGPIPDDHVVRFRPGMKTTELEEITLDRLELVSRADHMRRNSHANWPPELRRARAQAAWLTRTIYRLERGEHRERDREAVVHDQ